MTNTPISPHSGETPSPVPQPPESPRPKRPWTILGRLSQAVREQNWFAVVLELAIVVLGVVIGFQVTAWGQARSDAARERVLLRQVVADLEETEALMLRGDSISVIPEKMAVKLLQAYYTDDVPPGDSIMQWRLDSWGRHMPEASLQSIEALVSGSDRALLRDPELRKELMNYLVRAQFRLRAYRYAGDAVRQAENQIDDRYDDMEVLRWSRSPQLLDSLADADPLVSLASDQRGAFPFEPEAMLKDRDVYNALKTIHAGRRTLRRSRRYWREWSVDLREKIESYLDL